jgi:hypothetical protein
MSGAMSEVLRLTTALFDGARAALEAPLDGPALPVLSVLALGGLAALTAWRSADAGWPADAAVAHAAPSGWSGDAAVRGALGDAAGDAAALGVVTPGGGE